MPTQVNRLRVERAGEICCQRCEVATGAAEAVQPQRRLTGADAVISKDAHYSVFPGFPAALAGDDDRATAPCRVRPLVRSEMMISVKILSSDPVLAVRDLDRAADWFVRVLGCSRSEPDPGNWTFSSAGTVTFMLGYCPDALPATELGDHSYVAYLTVDSVDDYFERAVSEGADVLGAPQSQPWGRRELGLRTPDGFRLMLSERL